MGKFHPEYEKQQQELNEQFSAEAAKISVGDRCQVQIENDTEAKRGAVKFVGKTDFKQGYWVGVEYDEPIGKHNGTYLTFFLLWFPEDSVVDGRPQKSVEGKSYFVAKPKHGVMVRPDKVTVGDFPEEDLFADLED